MACALHGAQSYRRSALRKNQGAKGENVRLLLEIAGPLIDKPLYGRHPLYVNSLWLILVVWEKAEYFERFVC